MLNSNTIQGMLNALVRYLMELDVRVTLSDTNADNVSIAQLCNQHIIVNTRARDGLNCLFTIAHLFGHLIQRLSYDKYAHLIMRAAKPKPIIVDETFRRDFYEYEVEAFQIGKGLMLACFEIDNEMDSKYTLFMQTDFDHFWHYLKTGKQGDLYTFNQMLVKSFERWESNKLSLTPIPHPKPVRLDRTVSIEVF